DPAGRSNSPSPLSSPPRPSNPRSRVKELSATEQRSQTTSPSSVRIAISFINVAQGPNRFVRGAGLRPAERKPASRGALNTTRGLAGGTRFPPRDLRREAQASPARLIAEMNVVVVVGEGERRATEPEQ